MRRIMCRWTARDNRTVTTAVAGSSEGWSGTRWASQPAGRDPPASRARDRRRLRGRRGHRPAGVPTCPRRPTGSRSSATTGLVIFDSHWYGGHSLPGYSMIFPLLAALLGSRLVGAIACIARDRSVHPAAARSGVDRLRRRGDVVRRHQCGRPHRRPVALRPRTCLRHRRSRGRARTPAEPRLRAVAAVRRVESASPPHSSSWWRWRGCQPPAGDVPGRSRRPVWASPSPPCSVRVGRFPFPWTTLLLALVFVLLGLLFVPRERVVVRGR